MGLCTFSENLSRRQGSGSGRELTSGVPDLAARHPRRSAGAAGGVRGPVPTSVILRADQLFAQNSSARAGLRQFVTPRPHSNSVAPCPVVLWQGEVSEPLERPRGPLRRS